MAIFRIDSADDTRLAIFRALPKSQLAKQGGYFITEGDTVTQRMLNSRYEPVAILLEPQYLAKFESLVSPEVEIYVVSHDIMLQTVGFPFHRGVMGAGRRVRLPRFEQVLTDPALPCFVVVLPETQDPTNLGVMLRTSAAFGVDAVLLGPACAELFSRRVIRVSMGAALHLPIGYLPQPQEDLRTLQTQHACELWATVLNSAATSLHCIAPSHRCGLLFGSEGHGLSPSLIAQCAQQVTIPMDSRVDSLNASVAAGIFLYYFAQQRASGGIMASK